MNVCVSYFFFLFIMGAVDPCNAQTAVFRYAATPTDPLNRVAISRYGAPGSQPIASLPVPSGVTLITDPAAVQNANGLVFVAVLDSMARLWTILFNGVSGAWGNWIFMGGVVNHRIPPAIALKSDNLAYIVAIDFGGSLWVNTIDSSGIPGQ